MKRFAFFIAAWLVIGLSAPSAWAHIIGNVILTPSSLDFPDTRTGETSNTQTITLTKSPSFLPVNIYDVTLIDDTNFTIVNDGCSGQVLFNFNSCDIDFTFNPQSTGHFSTAVVIIDSGRQIANVGSLSGQGVEPQVLLSRNDIDFGQQFINQSGTQPVTLFNVGNDVLNISDISITSGDPEFTLTDNCPDMLAPNTNCQIDVTFAPTMVGIFTGQVTITDDADDSPQEISLSGEGIASGPDADLSPTDIDFPLTVVGAESDPVIVTLENDGDSPLNISSVAITSQFVLGDGGTCPTDMGFSLGIGESCTFEAIFAPDIAGPVTGTLTVTDNAADSPHVVFMSGTGIDPGSANASLSANSLDFGEQEINTTTTQGVTITNTGNEPLDIASIELGGLDFFAYNIIESCSGLDIPIGGSCTIMVDFIPVEAGTFDAVITITSNATDSPQTVTLTGIGIGGGNIGGGGCSLGTGPSSTWNGWSFILAYLGLGLLSVSLLRRHS